MYLVIVIYQGLLDKVKVFKTRDEAQEFYSDNISTKSDCYLMEKDNKSRNYYTILKSSIS